MLPANKETERSELPDMTPTQRKMIANLYHEMHKLLFSYAISSLPSDSQAEEAIQVTFQIACEKVEDIASSPNPQGWIFNTLKNVVSNELKQHLRDTRIITDTLGAHVDKLGSSTDNIDVDLLYGNVANTDEFKLIKAIALDGKSMLELSKELGISIDATKKRAQRAREYLQRRIK